MERGSWLFGESREGEYRLQLVTAGNPGCIEFDLRLMLLEGSTWALWTYSETGNVLRVLRAPKA